MFFKPLKNTGPLHFFLDIFSTTRPRAQKELIISLLTNNPRGGIICLFLIDYQYFLHFLP